MECCVLTATPPASCTLCVCLYKPTAIYLSVNALPHVFCQTQLVLKRQSSRSVPPLNKHTGLVLTPQANAGCLRLWMLARRKGVVRKSGREKSGWKWLLSLYLWIYFLSILSMESIFNKYYNNGILKADNEQRGNRSRWRFWCLCLRLLSAELINRGINMTFQGNRDREGIFCDRHTVFHAHGEKAHAVECHKIRWIPPAFLGCLDLD